MGKTARRRHPRVPDLVDRLGEYRSSTLEGCVRQSVAEAENAIVSHETHWGQVFSCGVLRCSAAGYDEGYEPSLPERDD